MGCTTFGSATESRHLEAPAQRRGPLHFRTRTIAERDNGFMAGNELAKRLRSNEQLAASQTL